MDSMIALAGILFILSMINERIANFIKLQFSDKKIIGIPLGNLKEKKELEGEEDDRARRIILLNIIVGTIVSLLLRADLINIIAHIDQPSAGIGWANFEDNLFNWLSLLPGCILTGCFLSLGSKFWHDLLDLLLYTKDLKGQLLQTNAKPNALNEAALLNLEVAADQFKQDTIQIENVTTVALNSESNIPFMEVYTGKDFKPTSLIPPKLFYLDQQNKQRSIEVKIIPDFDPTTHSELWPSDSILNAQPYPNNRGSIGGKVYDQTTNEPYFISCYHVVKSPSHNWTFTANGNELVNTHETNSHCGELVKAIRDNEIDAAIMKAKNGFVIKDGINGIGAATAVRDLSADDKRLKTKVRIYSGMSQELKVGYVSDLNVPADIRYFKDDHSNEMVYHRMNKLIFIKSIDASPFSQGGDSGSFVIDEYNYIIGMIVGGRGTRSFVVPINPILNKLHIKTQSS